MGSRNGLGAHDHSDSKCRVIAHVYYIASQSIVGHHLTLPLLLIHTELLANNFRELEQALEDFCILTCDSHGLDKQRVQTM